MHNPTQARTLEILNAVSESAQSGGCALEFVDALAEAINMALESMDGQLKLYSEVVLKTHSVDAHDSDLRLTVSLLHLLQKQAKVGRDLFEKIEVAQFEAKRLVAG